MTYPDAMKLLRQKVEELGQAEVARRLGYSSGSPVCQVLKGIYKGSPNTMLGKVIEVFGGLTVTCPELGEITLVECSDHKKRQPTTDSFYARMFVACRSCKGGK